MPRLLDLFCGAGGSSVGYARAGFDVVGVDNAPHPDYPFELWEGDALDTLSWLREAGAGEFDVVHASPPCPHHSFASAYQGQRARHPDLIPATRAGLRELPVPSVIENVPNVPATHLRRDLLLCGEMFGLRLHRHRVFEVEGAFAWGIPHGRHNLRGALTNCELGPGVARWITGNFADAADAADAMGVDWTLDRRGLANMIPPAYTEYIGAALLDEVERRREPVAA